MPVGILIAGIRRQEVEMFVGVVKTKDVLLHPWIMITMRGFRGFLKLVVRALSSKQYSFINNIENTQWITLPEKE